PGNLVHKAKNRFSFTIWGPPFRGGTPRPRPTTRRTAAVATAHERTSDRMVKVQPRYWGNVGHRHRAASGDRRRTASQAPALGVDTTGGLHRGRRTVATGRHPDHGRLADSRAGPRRQRQFDFGRA